MLKFLRKYQMLVLVVGGSLLMVVFLLQPVLERLGPNPMNRTVATIGPNDNPISAGQRQQAVQQVEMLRRIAPVVFDAPVNVDFSQRGREIDHWLLLAREAEAAGLVGETEDGLAWIPELAVEQTRAELVQSLRAQYGNDPAILNTYLNFYLQQPDFVTQLTQQTQAREQRMINDVRRAAASFRETSEDDAAHALSVARGIRRMIDLYNRAPRFPEQQAVAIAREQLDAVVVDHLVLDAASFTSTVDEPTDAQLLDHLETYKDFRPGQGDHGYGYRLPPRAKLAWLMLDAAAVRDTVQIGRVDLFKRYESARSRFPGTFAEERDRVLAELRDERTAELLALADRAIRAEMLRSLMGVEQNGIWYSLPDDWQTPDLSVIADKVVSQLKSTANVDFPRPTVETRNASWLTSSGIRDTLGLGGAAYALGSRRITADALPAFATNREQAGAVLPVQIGVPLFNPAAEDRQGNRYYVTVLDARPESPAESIAEVGRQRLVDDFKQLEAYRRLETDLGHYAELAKTGDLELLRERASEAAGIEPGPQALSVGLNAQVRRTDIRFGSGRTRRDDALNADDARARIVAFAEGAMAPLAEPGSLDLDDAIFALTIPQARSVAVVKVVARRPLTAQEYRQQGVRGVLANAVLEEIESVADIAADYPFSYDALARRLNYRPIDDEAAPADEPAESPAG